MSTGNALVQALNSINKQNSGDYIKAHSNSSVATTPTTQANNNPLSQQYNNTVGKVNGTTSKLYETETEKPKQGFLSRLLGIGKDSTTDRWAKRGVGEFSADGKQTSYSPLAPITGKVDKDGNVQWKTKMDYANELEQKYANDKNKNTWFGKFETNFDVGSLQEEINLATSEYLKDPTKENYEYLEKIKSIASNYQNLNAETVGQGGKLNNTFAQYLPQLKNQISTQVDMMGRNPLFMANPNMTKAGTVLGSGISSYNDMYGAAFNELTPYTKSESLARSAAEDEAKISSAIEMGDTAIDMTVGAGKFVANAIGKTVTREVVDQASKTFVKQLMGALKDYGVSVASEGNEEAMQQVITIANRMRVQDGKGDGGTKELLEYCYKVLDQTYGRHIKSDYGKGNIDLNKRGTVTNADGSISTVDSFSINIDGKEVLLPTVIKKAGKWVKVSQEEALEHYRQTGEYLGKFDTVDEANKYAQELHEKQAKMYVDGEAYKNEIKESASAGRTIAAILGGASMVGGHLVGSSLNGLVNSTTETTNTETQNILDTILDGSEESYSRAATQILNNQEALSLYQERFGNVEGNSKTEQARNIATTLRNAVRESELAEQNAQAEAQRQAQTEQQTPQTLDGAENPMAITPNNMTAEQSYVRGLIMNGEASEILSNEQNRAIYEQLTGEKLSAKDSEAYQQIMKQSRNTFSGETTLTENAINNNEISTETVGNTNSQTTAENSAEAVKPPVSSNVEQTTQNNPLTRPETTNPQAQPTQVSNLNAPSGRNDTAPTQNSLFEDTLTEEEYNNAGGQTTHEVHHDVDVQADASARISANRQGAVDSLLNTENYSDVDVAMSNQIITEEVDKLRSMSNPNEIAEQYKLIATLRSAREKAGTKLGQALRQMGRFGGSTVDIVSDAIEQMFGENARLRKGVTQEEAQKIVDKVNGYATTLNDLATDDADGLIQLIHDVSKERKTTGMFSAEDSKLVDNALHKVLEFEGGIDFLRNLATTQIRSIAGDYKQVGIIDAIKGIRYLNALSNLKTTNTNVGANTVYGGILSAITNNASIPFDAAISLLSGNREIAFDRGYLSKEGLKSGGEAMVKSFLEVTLDAEASMSTYAYNEIKGSTFKMTGNWLERWLATVSKYQGYALKTTDQVAKGVTEGEITRGLKGLGKTDAEISEIATEEAKHRTLQSDSKVAKDLNKFKKWASEIHIGNEKTGTYGIGDHFIMFAQVPANQVVTQLEMQPAVGSLVALEHICKLATGKIKNGQIDAKTQRATSKALGNLVTGSALAGGAFLMSMYGILRCVDEDDDDDVVAMLKAEGKTGTQMNLSALGRILHGGDSRPQEGDTWMALNWIPQLNSLMIFGDAMRKSKEDDGTISTGEILLSSWKGLIDSLKDFPAVSGITSTIKSFNYAKYEGDDRADLSEGELFKRDAIAKIGAVAGNELGNLASGLTTSNAVRAVTTGLDEYERDTYASNNPLTRAIDYVKSGIPGLRQTIDKKIDGFGNEVKNEGGVTQFLNKVVLPGALTHDRQTEAQKFAEDMYNATGKASVVPDRKAPSSMSINIDGEKSTVYLTDEESRKWQTTYGSTVEQLYLDASRSQSFKNLTSEEQVSVLSSLKSIAKGLADSEFKEGRGAESGNNVTRLLYGEEKVGDDRIALPMNDIVNYHVNKISLKDAIKNDEYSTIDKIVKNYDSFSDDLKTIFSEDTDIEAYIKASKAGIKAENWSLYRDSLKAVQKEEDTKSDGSRLKYKAIIESGLSDTEQQKLIDMDDNISKNWKMADEVLSAHGFTKQQIYDFFENADWTLSQKTDEYSANGQLGAYEAFAALQQLNIPNEEKKNIFDAFVVATGEPGRYDGWSRLDKRTAKYVKYNYKYISDIAKNYGLSSYTKGNQQSSNTLTNASSGNSSSLSNALVEALKRIKK